MRRWLVYEHKLPEELLRSTMAGATSITPWQMAKDRSVADGGKPRETAVLPALVHGHARFAQLYPVDPAPAHQPYLNAPNNSHLVLGRYRPVERHHQEILVTRDIMDALSANVAGYRAVAILSADPVAPKPPSRSLD